MLYIQTKLRLTKEACFPFQASPHKSYSFTGSEKKLIVYETTMKNILTLQARKAAQWLRMYTAPAEDPNSVPSIHMGWLTTTYNSTSEDLTPLVSMDTGTHVYILTQQTHRHRDTHTVK